MTTSNDLNTYQDQCMENAVFPRQNWNTYLPMNLASEAGEVAGKFAKYFRGDGPVDNDEVAKELGDVLWHVAVMARFMGYDLSDITEMNTRKLRSRKLRGKIMGNGDNR